MNESADLGLTPALPDDRSLTPPEEEKARGRPRGAPPRVAGRYEILRALGAGGMATISLARDTQLGRLVALKRLAASFATKSKRARFEAEALASARLQHPNLIQTHELIWGKRDLYLVMEYIEGESLAARLADGPLERDEALRIAQGMAAGLAHAHSQNVIHRDLKPGNVMLGADGRVILIDFGLAKRIDTSQALTQSGQFLGTPTYVPPEQINDGKRADARADLYGLGACLYHMLCGRPPFECEGLAQLVSAILVTPPEPPGRVHPGADPELTRICLRCLKKSPSDRFADAEELLARLREAESRAREPSRAGWVLLGLCVAVGLGAAGALALDPELPKLPPPSTPTPITSGGPARDLTQLRLRRTFQLSIPGKRYGNRDYAALTLVRGSEDTLLVAFRSDPHQLSRWNLSTRSMEASWRVGIDRVAASHRGDSVALMGGYTLSFFPANHDPAATQAPRRVHVRPAGWYLGWTTSALAFSRDDSLVALASQGGGIAVLDVASGALVQSVGAKHYFGSCALDEGLVFASFDGSKRGPAGIGLWNLSSGAALDRRRVPGAGPSAWLPGRRIAFGGQSEHVGVVRLTPEGFADLTFLDAGEERAEPGGRPRAHTFAVTAIGGSADALYTGAGITDGQGPRGERLWGEVRRWDPKSLALIETISLPAAPMRIHAHRGGVLVLTNEGRIHSFEWSPKEEK